MAANVWRQVHRRDAGQLQEEYDVTADHAKESVIELAERLLSERLVSLPASS